MVKRNDCDKCELRKQCIRMVATQGVMIRAECEGMTEGWTIEPGEQKIGVVAQAILEFAKRRKTFTLKQTAELGYDWKRAYWNIMKLLEMGVLDRRPVNLRRGGIEYLYEFVEW